MAWEYKEEDGLKLRTCDICKSTQVKCADGEWAVYLTYERIERHFQCLMEGIKETCAHTPEEGSE